MWSFKSRAKKAIDRSETESELDRQRRRRWLLWFFAGLWAESLSVSGVIIWMP